MIPLFIPSTHRSTPSDIAHGPVPHLSDAMRQCTAFVVPPDQYVEYRASVPEDVEVLQCPEVGIAAVRHWIGRNVRNDKFVMLDDDVHFLVRRGPDMWQMRKTEKSEVDDLFRTVENLLYRYGHVGVSGREGNNRIGVGEPPLIAENTRTIRFLAYRTEDFLRAEHGRVRVMEDFDVNLQLLRRGVPNCSIHYWAQGQRMTNAPGGCSTYRSHEVHEQSAIRLAELHPGLVSLRQKQNKTGGDFGTRTEVTIQWKRALNHG